MIRSCILLTIILVHVVLLYQIAHAPPRRTLDGPPMFGAAIAEKPVIEQAHPVQSRPWQSASLEKATHRVQEWHFPRVDIWPVTGEPCPTPAEFGPLMEALPVADEAQVLTRLPIPPKIPRGQKPRMVLWLRPAYPLEWARTEMEGTVALGLRIRSTGNTEEIQIERSSGSQKLDGVAAEAAKSWRFAPEHWQGQPIESKTTVELTFRFFEFYASVVDDEVASDTPKRDLRRRVPTNRSELVRTQLEQLRIRGKNVFAAPAYADHAPAWPTSMRGWGPISGVQYLGPIGKPEWKRYKQQLKFQLDNSVVARWELYRVVHDDHAALWEVLLDHTGGMWALKAESLESLERANKAAVGCPSDNFATTRL